MQYKDLKDKAKKLGLRVTKTVDGKRVKLTARELRAKVTRNFENSVKNAQRVIRICRTVVAPTTSFAPPPPPEISTVIVLETSLPGTAGIVHDPFDVYVVCD